MDNQNPNALRRSLLIAGSTLALAPRLALAQAKYPSRPVDFIVPWGPGGGADQLARRLASLIEKDIGTSLPILNIAGATGNTGMTKLLSAPADGYSMAVFIADTLGTLAGGAGRYKLSDLAPLGIMIRQPSGLFVKADAKWKTFDELLAEAKTREIKVGITGFGGPDEMHVVKFNEQGAKFRPVPFAKPGERYSSVLGGHADVVIEQAGDVRSFLDSKQMRPILFFADQPQVGHEGIALARKYGVTLAISQFRAIVMRAGTDPSHVAAMAAAMDKAAQTPEFKKYLADELAFADSYIPAAKAGPFMEEQLALINANMPKKS
ncbi:MAG: tripartite tricarboxylate transporter substrate binding protein [Burkholderiales bacterium]|nr:tripartite tricarboxylate transporter substrate binding protein [Burkholderiales bacterium]